MTTIIASLSKQEVLDGWRFSATFRDATVYPGPHGITDKTHRAFIHMSNPARVERIVQLDNLPITITIPDDREGSF